MLSKVLKSEPSIYSAKMRFVWLPHNILIFLTIVRLLRCSTSCSQLDLGLSFALEMDVGRYHESDFDWMGPTSIQMLTTVGHIYNHVSVFPSGNRFSSERKKKSWQFYLSYFFSSGRCAFVSVRLCEQSQSNHGPITIRGRRSARTTRSAARRCTP